MADKSRIQEYDEKKGKEKYDKTYWEKYTDSIFEESKNWRGTNVELQWFVNYMYYKGFQNLKYDKRTNDFVRDNRNPLNFYVNYTYMICRAVRNAVVRTQPTWDVDALPYGDISNDESQLLGEFLAFEYGKLKMEDKVNKAVLFGLLYGIGIFQYGYDDMEDDGEGNTWIETLDPFDTYIDPYATSSKDARYIVKVMSKPLDVVKENKHYDQKAIENLSTTNEMSESQYKNMIIDNESDTGSIDGNVKMHESWCRTKEGIRVITTCSGETLRNELTDFEDLPFEFYLPDINVNTIYGEGWVKNIVPLNKALNYLETSRLEYNIIFNKGKMLIPKGAGVKNITNQNGQKIYYKPGLKPEIQDMKPIGSDVDRQIGALGVYMQQIGAANEAFLGQTPAGVTSGIAIETLVANNYVNLTDLINNLANTLEALGTDILNLGYSHQNLMKPFRASDSKYYGVIGGGQEAPEIENYDKIVSIPKNPEVKVRITSGTAHTKEGKRDIYLQLRAAGDLSRQTLLDTLDIDPEQEQDRLVAEQVEMAQGMQEAQAQAQETSQIDPEAPLPEGMQIQV